MQNAAQKRALALISLLGAVILWSGSLSVVRIAVTHASPGTITFWRCVIGSFVLGVWALARMRRTPNIYKEATKKSWFYAALAGATCGAAFLLIAVGMESVGSGPAGVVLSLIPGFTVVISAIEGNGEPITPRIMLSLLIGIVGAFAVAFSSGGYAWSVMGLTVLLVAAISHSATNVASGCSLRRLDPIAAAAVTMGVAALVALPFASFSHGLPMNTIFAIFVLGLLPSGIAYVMYFYGIKILGTERASFSNYLVPPIAVVAGMITLHEMPDTTMFIGLSLATLALFVGSGGSSVNHPNVELQRTGSVT